MRPSCRLRFSSARASQRELFNLSISELSALAASSDSRVSEDLSGQGYRISVPIEGEGTSIVYFRCAGMERGE